jgi:hypothetical protein
MAPSSLLRRHSESFWRHPLRCAVALLSQQRGKNYKKLPPQITDEAAQKSEHTRN